MTELREGTRILLDDLIDKQTAFYAEVCSQPLTASLRSVSLILDGVGSQRRGYLMAVVDKGRANAAVEGLWAAVEGYVVEHGGRLVERGVR